MKCQSLVMACAATVSWRTKTPWVLTVEYARNPLALALWNTTLAC